MRERAAESGVTRIDLEWRGGLNNGATGHRRTSCGLLVDNARSLPPVDDDNQRYQAVAPRFLHVSGEKFEGDAKFSAGFWVLKATDLDEALALGAQGGCRLSGVGRGASVSLIIDAKSEGPAQGTWIRI